ncbi:relaxase, partial [Escherichia coli]|nr:relaxase [Escherichia coli]
MIVRYGGGNDGVVDYLINGRKAERQYTRDELDHRVVLDGDLQTTDKIIDSIENKSQERYLHITLSFHESHVSNEVLKAVVDDYKKLLMNAYHPDEYSFYAEAHLPKIRHIQDNSTGELVERKPHIHIVIPKVNLITEKFLNPVGDVTKGHTIEQLDAIQEFI